MAQLRDIAKRLKVDLDVSEKQIEQPASKTSRPWRSVENQVHRPGLETRFIDQVDKPDQSITSIDQVKNQVDQPKPTNQVYKPSSMTLENLRGNPLRVIRFLFSAIDNFNEKITRKIQLVEIMQALEITRDSARTGLKFLNKSNLISTVDYFAGLNGWTRYRMQDEIFNEIWSINQVHKSDSKPGLISSNNNKITTMAGDGWENVDISPLEDRGLTKNSLLQLKNLNTPEITQESIYHFAFSLEFNEKIKAYKDPISALIVTLKRGEAWIDPNYISPRERAQRALLEARKREQERMQQLEKEQFDLEFSAWESSLPADERKQIAPDKAESFANAKLRAYFNENIWPAIKNSI